MKKINYERKETIRNWGILRKASESFGVSNKTFKGKCECGGSVVTAYDGERVCQNCGKVNGAALKTTRRSNSKPMLKRGAGVESSDFND